ncbi:hypothetical protein BDY21DRAFT_388223 [Lineolata rhizophorae]|uniref:C2H2-type domain-containing protein n=1 Tax=Lineolata rhizophorae TaxID=578093 RepID=A0A6A6NNC6_9PEZI|nr:hypothetical protein BDY21DRAFT_388223 [Lineolata rhizophorae]
MSQAAAVPDTDHSAGKKRKRFQCQHCQRLFARLEHLQRHERTHTLEKPFCCTLCDHRFTRRDLLIRHERLSHNKDAPQAQSSDGSNRPTKRRRTVTIEGINDQNMSPPSAPPPPYDPGSAPLHSDSTQPQPSNPEHAQNSDDSLLATLSMAAERAALENGYGDPPVQPHQLTPNMPLAQEEPVQAPAEPIHAIQPAGHTRSPGLEFEESLNNLATFLDNGPLSSYNFSSLINAEQPMPFFSPESLTYATDFVPQSSSHQDFPNFNGDGRNNLGEQNTFSCFGSRLPSLQPEDTPPPPQPQAPSPSRTISDISLDDRQGILLKMVEFTSVVSPDFKLPSRLALSRYVAGYINGFHEHLPFLHLPTMSIESCSVELLLAMAAVGAQYCFEGDKGVELFHASQAIATARIRRRDSRLAAYHRSTESDRPASNGLTEVPSGAPTSNGSVHSQPASGPLGLPSELDLPEREDLMQTAQALLLLMAMATWAKHKEILRQALAIQSILATLVRDDGLQTEPMPDDISWTDWLHAETIKRTKLIVFCFFNLHCIVYNIPPLLLNSELSLPLPASSAEFKATSATEWREARRKAHRPAGFQEALRRLFSRGGRDITEWNSSLGNYILIHALIQHIFFVRQTARCRFDGDGELAAEDVAQLELALRNWQIGWKRNPESSLDPMDPNGPVAFNSTALLRLAYIRLNVDTGPGRGLDTRDPVQIAKAFQDSLPIRRTPKLVRAALHSAHSLSIPVKIGIRLVAKTQAFIWSIQHSLCSLECAFLLSKWLGALANPDPGLPVTNDEWRIVGVVKTMLDETEFAVPCDAPLESPETLKHLSAGVLRVWGAIFRGAQTWAIVDVIGTSLNIYADMLEAG